MSVLCLKCSYSVTEPICASCAVSEIKIWFYKERIKDKVIKKINKEFKYLLNDIASIDYVTSDASDDSEILIMKCIRCKKDMHLMCFYCVTNKANQIIKNNLEDKEILKNFQESFSTKLYDYESNKDSSLF